MTEQSNDIFLGCNTEEYKKAEKLTAPMRTYDRPRSDDNLSLRDCVSKEMASIEDELLSEMWYNRSFLKRTPERIEIVEAYAAKQIMSLREEINELREELRKYKESKK